MSKAVELYVQGRSSTILMSGGKKTDHNSRSVSEASMMKTFAVDFGVPEKNILIEEESLSTKENMIYSSVLLDNHFKKILLVTTRFHMRRAYLMACRYFPDWIQIVPCPADDTNTLRENWYRTEQGAERARNEVIKLIAYIRQGIISDFIIE